MAGSRSITDYEVVKTAIELSEFDISLLIAGGARGVDTVAVKYALRTKIPFKIYEADWGVYGKSAGYKRNELMAENADACIVIWDGVSKGSEHMLNIAKKKDLKLFLFLWPSGSELDAPTN